jgi:hypothetical protein
MFKLEIIILLAFCEYVLCCAVLLCLAGSSITMTFYFYVVAKKKKLPTVPLWGIWSNTESLIEQ